MYSESTVLTSTCSFNGRYLSYLRKRQFNYKKSKAENYRSFLKQLESINPANCAAV